ncbi:MAG: YihY/virulence factor BrkB family protein [Bacteroidales bacterium]|nr:YihY/virulence factor BrkB family protein [Bacteroidales bacterium]
MNFKIENVFPISLIIGLLKKIKISGTKDISLYDVFVLFFDGLKNGAINTRASSISFNLFFGIFPAIIFLFTLVPYIPIDNLQPQLMDLLKSIIPSETYAVVKATIEDIISRPRGGLLSVGFVAALFVSSNGIKAMIDGFNQSYHIAETRSGFKTRLISILLVFILSFLVFIGIALIIITAISFEYINRIDFLKGKYIIYLLIVAKWLIIVMLCYFVTSFLYYLGPAKKMKWKGISIGSIFVTFLMVLTYIGFNFYINNFAKYNAIYGSIGTLIVLLLWININSLVLLIGYELNVSIYRAMNPPVKTN